MGYLFFSTECDAPAGYFLMKTLVPIEKKFNTRHTAEEYDDSIDSLCIVFICVSEQKIENGYCKERKYISRKKKYADIRLRLPYLDYLQADETQRKSMCLDIIHSAIIIVQKKIPSYPAERLYQDICAIFEEQ